MEVLGHRSMKTIYIYTLGCKVNRYESEALADFFAASGRYEMSGEHDKNAADVTVINSCMVTEESEKKVRKLIRRIRRENPQTVILLCGCLPQAAPEKASEMGADIICGNKNRRQSLELLDRCFNGDFTAEKLPDGVQNAVVPHLSGDKFEILAPVSYRELTRANLKIQDGCNRYCAYCIIPYARGSARSMPIGEVYAQARRLISGGHKEIVLTGINLGLYGTDNGSSIAEAAETVASAGAERIRLGSLEIDLLNDELLARLAAIKGLCPHFHTSLQSGSDTVLKRMNRRYDTAEYTRIIGNIRRLFKDVSITTDIIVGFPGETEEEFSESKAFCEKTGFYKIHVFPYSRREGTKAAAMENQIQEDVKKRRAAEMAKVGARLYDDFRSRQIGRKHSVLFETYEGGFCFGHTENYLYVKAPSDISLKNITADVIITGTDGEFCLCSIAKP